MYVIINYEGKNFKLFRISNRNREGGFTGGLCLKHTNYLVKDWHFTYPSNGEFHETIITSKRQRLLFFPDKVILKREDAKVIYDGKKHDTIVKRLASLDLIPFGSGRKAPSIFEIINGQVFSIMNFHINTSALFLFPEYTKKASSKDFLFCVDDYKNESLILEVFMSMDGNSNIAKVECLKEKTLDQFLPIVKLRIVKQL